MTRDNWNNLVTAVCELCDSQKRIEGIISRLPMNWAELATELEEVQKKRKQAEERLLNLVIS